MPFYPGGGGGGSGVGDVTADPAITNWDEASDGWYLASNGDGTATFEAPAVGGMYTPDGLTPVSRLREFHVEDYVTTGSRRVWHATWATTGGVTTVTCTGNTGVADTPHDFTVGSGLILMGAGPACAVTVNSTATGYAISTGGSAGSTTYEYVVIYHDGFGGHTAVTSALSIATGNATLTATNHILLKMKMPYGAVAATIYGRGTSGRKKLVDLDLSQPWRSDNTSCFPAAYTLTNNGGAIRLAVSDANHGLQIGDYINLTAISGGNYNGQHLVSGVSGTTVDCATTAYTSNGTGYVRSAQFYWRDCGDLVPFSEKKYVPDMENYPQRWRAGMALRRGQQMVDTTNNQCFRCAEVVGDRRSGATEPVWSTDQRSMFSDGKAQWVRDLEAAPVAQPGAARNQALLTKVATIPTSATFTTEDAATADNASHKLALSHNAAFAFAECMEAALDYAKPCVIRVSEAHQLWLPKHTDTRFWRSHTVSSTWHWTIFDLKTGTLAGPEYSGRPTISVKMDPGAVVRVRPMQNGPIAEDVTASVTALGGYHMLLFGANDIEISGGTWEWAQFAGGMTEIDTSGSYSQSGDWAMQSSSTSASVVAHRLRVSDVDIHWPSVFTAIPINDSDGQKRGSQLWTNVRAYYGGGDGDLLFQPHGDFIWTGGEVRNVYRLGSHAFYFGILNSRFKVLNTVLGEIVSKYPIHIRGAGGDSWATDVQVANVTFDRCAPCLVGDITSGNRTHRVSFIGCHGGSLQYAECRNVEVIGGYWEAIDVREDCAQVKISNLVVDAMDLGPSDASTDLQVSKVTCKGSATFGRWDGARVDGLEILNGWTKTTSLVSGVYEWIKIGATDEYYCRLRATGGNPGFATPTANATVLQVRDVATMGTGTTGPGTLGSLTDDSWTFADATGSLGYSTYVVKIGDSEARDPDSNPFGTVYLGTAATGNVVLNNALTNVTFRDLSVRSTWGALTACVRTAGGGSTPTLTNVKFENPIFVKTGLSISGSAAYLFDLGTTAMPWCDLRFNGGRFYMNPTDIVRGPIQVNLALGGNVWFEGVDLKYFGSAGNIQNAFGQIHLKNCEVQTNEVGMTLTASTDVTAHVDANLWSDGTSHEMIPFAYPASSMPSVLTHGTKFVRRTSDGKLYADSSFGGGAFNIAADATITVRVEDCARLALANNFEFIGDNSLFNAYGICEGNLWRGSRSATYADITADQNNYQLTPLLTEHRLNPTTSARAITGFDAPANGTVDRDVVVINIGSQNLTYPPESGSSAAENGFLNVGGLTVTQPGNTVTAWSYDKISQRWRLKWASVGVTAA